MSTTAGFNASPSHLRLKIKPTASIGSNSASGDFYWCRPWSCEFNSALPHITYIFSC